jgi:2-succinyl-5-enolpyruvyl-6-hydroxy-3-cyclohexene-1-carboxylate synthase
VKQEKVSLQEAVADASVARLCALGVTDVVLSPGRRNAPLLIAFSRSSLSITSIVDERAAGFFALGLSRSSDRPVVMCCTSGSAAANYLPSIVEAYHSNIPLLVMSADRPEKLHGRGSAQTMRQDNLYGHFTGAALQLPLQSRQARIDSAFDEIENRLTQRLPAHLNIEFDEPLWTCAPSVNRAEAALPRRPLSTVFKSKDFECLFEENGVILCGADTVRDSTGRQAILDLAQHLSWPVFAEAASNVRFGSPDDGVLSCYEALIRSEAITDLKPSSFLRFGRSAMPRAVSEWLLEVAAGRMTTVGVGVEIHDPDELATHHVRAQPMDYAAAALREFRCAQVATGPYGGCAGKPKHARFSMLS